MGKIHLNCQQNVVEPPFDVPESLFIMHVLIATLIFSYLVCVCCMLKRVGSEVQWGLEVNMIMSELYDHG
jgi:hypothetical protein